MSAIHKLKTLLTDLRDKIQRRQWHVRCLHCTWEVHNLDHERFALRRAKLHSDNAHGWTQHVAELLNDPVAMYEVWHSRA